jgi:hypothetical protein
VNTEGGGGRYRKRTAGFSRNGAAWLRIVSDSGPPRAPPSSDEMSYTSGRLLAAGFLAAAIAGAQTQEVQQPAAEASPPVPAEEKPIPLKQVPIDILHDQKIIWTFPLKAIRGQHWRPVMAICSGHSRPCLTRPSHRVLFS